MGDVGTCGGPMTGAGGHMGEVGSCCGALEVLRAVCRSHSAAALQLRQPAMPRRAESGCLLPVPVLPSAAGPRPTLSCAQVSAQLRSSGQDPKQAASLPAAALKAAFATAMVRPSLHPPPPYPPPQPPALHSPASPTPIAQCSRPPRTYPREGMHACTRACHAVPGPVQQIIGDDAPPSSRLAPCGGWGPATVAKVHQCLSPTRRHM